MTMTDDVKAETKTARRKRQRAERAASAAQQIQLAEQRALARRIEKLQLRLCSPWWAEHVGRTGAVYLPNAECSCRRCKGLRKWPSPCVSARALSFECHVLALAPKGKDERWRRVSQAEASAAGLHVVRRRVGEHQDHPGGITVMVAGCEMCEGLRPHGERHCAKCRTIAKREMEEAGYFNQQKESGDE